MMELPTVPTVVLVVWVQSSSFMLTMLPWKGAVSLMVLPKVGSAFSLRYLILMTLEGLFRSPDALRPLILCNCDCKLFTSAICRGLHWYTMRCNHFHRVVSHLGK